MNDEPRRPAARGAAETVRASGSSALQPLVNAAKERFESDQRSISVEVSAGGSNKGLSDVASGAVHIGNSDVFAPVDLERQLVDHRVAVVGFAAMANRGAFDEHVVALTIEQLAGIFSGAVRDWSEVGGARQRILVINRAPGSGTRRVFGNAIFGRTAEGDDRFVESQTEDNSGALVAKLEQTRGSISYLALSFEDAALFTIPLAVGARVVRPTSEAITDGTYPIWSYEHMYTKGLPRGATRLFIDYVLSPEFQANSLPRVKGFLPVAPMKTQKDVD